MRERGGIWDRLTVTCALSFCLLVAGLSVGIVLGELRDQLGISGVVAAAHGSAFGVGMLLLGAFGSGFVARIGRPTAFRGACTTIVIGLMLLCVGQAWPITLLGSSLAGVACSMLVLLMPGIIADHHGDRRGQAFAAVNGIPGLSGIAFSLIVGAVIAAGGSWRWPYALLTLAFAVGVAIAARGVAIPDAATAPVDVLPLFRRPDVARPWLHIVHAVLVEFPVGIWSVAYLKEVGGASSGAAAALGAIWGLFMFLGRMTLPWWVARFGAWTRSICFGLATVGTLVMWAGPGLWPRVAGLTIVAIGAGPLYPLAVDRLYDHGGADTVSLGFVTALASGAAVTTGPLLLGVLADGVGLRHALLFVPVLAAVGVYVARPAVRRPEPAHELVSTG